MKRIFISRELDVTFLAQLEEMGLEIIHFSLLEIEPLQIDIPSVIPEWIFFYSKNGMKYFFDQHPFDASFKYGVMGSGSAVYFENLTQHQPDYIGSKPGTKLLSELNILFENSVVWIPQGTESLNFLQQLTTTKSQVPLKVYQNSKLDAFDISPCSYLAFTSPLNAEAYFDKYNYNGEKLFAIGATTAAHLRNMIQKEAYFPDEPGIQNLIDLILEKSV